MPRRTRWPCRTESNRPVDEVIRIVAIDPGVRTGWAGIDRELNRCWLATSEPFQLPRFMPEPDVVLVEEPVIYPGGRTKNPKSILGLAVQNGYWRATFNDTKVISIPAPSWTRRQPKKVRHGRMLVYLDNQWPSLEFNKSRSNEHERDALGMILWYLDGLRAKK